MLSEKQYQEMAAKIIAIKTSERNHLKQLKKKQGKK